MRKGSGLDLLYKTRSVAVTSSSPVVIPLLIMSFGLRITSFPLSCAFRSPHVWVRFHSTFLFTFHSFIDCSTPVPPFPCDQRAHWELRIRMLQQPSFPN